MRHASHLSQVQRLRRIHGQTAGLVRMVEEQRYCMDILTQLRAARAALGKVEEQILREHIAHCVAGAARSGRQGAVQEKVDELFAVLSKFGS